MVFQPYFFFTVNERMNNEIATIRPTNIPHRGSTKDLFFAQNSLITET